MTLSGNVQLIICANTLKVLIPLLVDDPLWDLKRLWKIKLKTVLIPLLVDDPLWVNLLNYFIMKKVLIPLLVDDPLWEVKTMLLLKTTRVAVLIPLLVDDPLWVRNNKGVEKKLKKS